MFFVCFCDLWGRKGTTRATVLQLHRGYNQPEQHELFPMATLQNTKRQRIEGNLDASWGVCNKCIFYGKNGTFITLSSIGNSCTVIMCMFNIVYFWSHGIRRGFCH
jgi:hypothetical protein